MQGSVILAFVASAAYAASQVPKIILSVQYYQRVGSKQTDRKLDEASDTASRIEDELVQAVKSGTITPEEYQLKVDQLKTAESNRSRAFEAYKPAN